MAETTYWISEHDVVSVLDLAVALEELRAGFAHEGNELAVELEKTMLGYGDHATLHALGAAFTGLELAGTKVWTHTPRGADPLLCLFDTRSGALVACIEAFALGQLRTSGTAALATDVLAPKNASVLAVIGTGKQALPQVAAVAQVRPLAEVRAYSRSPERREAFAAKVTDALGVRCHAAGSAKEAVEGADVVTLVTRATEPVLLDAMVTPGMHLNAVGAIDLERREFEPAILARCSAIVTDSLSQAKRLSSELREFFGTQASTGGGVAGSAEGAGSAHVGGWSGVRTLGAVVAAGTPAREPGDVTLFKGMGSGIEDVALGAAVLRRLGIGPGSEQQQARDPSGTLPGSVVALGRRGRAEVALGGRTDAPALR